MMSVFHLLTWVVTGGLLCCNQRQLLLFLSMFVIIKTDCELAYRDYCQQHSRADGNTRNILAHMQDVWSLASACPWNP